MTIYCHLCYNARTIAERKPTWEPKTIYDVFICDVCGKDAKSLRILSDHLPDKDAQIKVCSSCLDPREDYHGYHTVNKIKCYVCGSKSNGSAHLPFTKIKPAVFVCPSPCFDEYFQMKARSEYTATLDRTERGVQPFDEIKSKGKPLWTPRNINW